MIATSDHGLQTIVLHGDGAPAAAVGAKAAMLDRLLGFGAPVPRSGVVTTSAYRDFIVQSDLAEYLDRLSEQPLPPPEQVDVARIDVDRRFLRASMSDRLADAIIDLAQTVGGGAVVAVRSSATAEDLTSASFAGQYRTSLSVESGEVVDAVRLCWASLWHPGPRAYRRFRGIGDSDVAMAALVMPMLDPEWAGVLFTEDPTLRSVIRIEMVEGLGESLVSGARTPEVVTIERAEIATAETRPAGLGRLARVALDLEDRIGVPLDIEWALEGDDPVLLQARPITGCRAATAEHDDDGFDIATDGSRYTTAGIGEMLPGVLPPRIWDIDSWLVEEGFRGLFRRLGADLTGLEAPHALIGRVRGRAALDLDLMGHIVETVPGGSATELEYQYFGDALNSHDAPGSAPGHGNRMWQGVRNLRARAHAYHESEIAIQAIEGVLADERDPSHLDDRALLAMRGRLLHLACRAMQAEIGVAATAGASYRGLEMFLRQHLDPDEARSALQQLTQGDRARLRAGRALDLDGLAERLGSEEELQRVVGIEDWGEALEVLESSSAGRGFVHDMMSALRRAGSMSVFGGVTWEADPGAVWPMLRADRAPPQEATGSAAERRDAALADVERCLVSTPRWRLARWATGQIVDVRKRFLRREATDAAAFLERREHTKAALLMLGGVVWRIDRELGRRLWIVGALDDVDDVDLMTGREIARAVEGRPVLPDRVERRRRRLDVARLEPPLDRVFRGRPEPSPAPPIEGDRVTGWSGSPGWYEGSARVVDSPRASALRRGEVLVAHTTDASWLPLFHVAGAVVVEQGGPLSHASILARELGMPAVVNLPGIVDRVRACPGLLLTVDGNRGEVGLHPPGAAADATDCSDIDPTSGAVPAPRPPTVGGDDPNRLGVFITGLIGAGALMSIAIGVTQAIGSARSQQRISKRARLPAEALAIGTLLGFDAGVVGRAGLRRRGYYAWLAIVAPLLAVLALWIGDDYVERPSSAGSLWLLALGLLSAVTLVAFGLVALRAAAGWPVVSATARRLSLPIVHENRTPAQLLGRVHASSAAALLLGVLVLAWLTAEAEHQLQVVDKWLFDLVDAGTRDNWWYPTILDELLRTDLTVPWIGITTTVLIPLAVLLTAATYRCRPLMFTYPLVVASAGLMHIILQHFFMRDRPERGLKPGFDDSFPGGHANELTLILGLLPLVAYVLIRENWVRIVLEIVCAMALAAALADAVRVGDHWPTDNLAGFMIGAAMVLIARGVASAPGLHTRCNDCPAKRRSSREAARAS